MSIARVGEVVWYVTGRFYAEGKLLQDVGYFLHIQGIGGRLFDGERSESTARFTFSSEPFKSETIDNGGLEIGIDMRGTFRIYLREKPGATFDDPESFAQGKCIAELERVSIVPTVKATILTNVFSARLVSSEPFDFDGERYDFRDLAGYGVTQWGFAVPETGESAVPFAGSAIRI